VLAAIKPAFAFFSTPASEQPIVVSGAPVSSLPNSAAMASAANSGIDEEMPTIKDFPDIQVAAALVKELGSDKPMFAYHAAARWPLASITKLMTAVVALETLGPATLVKVTPDAVATEGESGNLKAGEKYSVIDLVRIMLTVSSNDAAIALAQAYDQKELGPDAYTAEINKTSAFIGAMRQKARDLGMNGTIYGDPSGLSVINQSIITDLETLINYISTSNPEILRMTTKKENVALERNSMTKRTYININEFAGQTDFLGGKTGFTDDASGNLASLFKYNGKQYLIIVFGTDDRFGATRRLYNWIKEVKAPAIVP
jgi:D-alanyl-D-alanine carboxypeptidase